MNKYTQIVSNVLLFNNICKYYYEWRSLYYCETFPTLGAITINSEFNNKRFVELTSILVRLFSTRKSKKFLNNYLLHSSGAKLYATITTDYIANSYNNKDLMFVDGLIYHGAYFNLSKSLCKKLLVLQMLQLSHDTKVRERQCIV